MNRKASESAVDRLIALALDEKPAQPETPDAPTEIETVPVFSDAELPSARELEHNPMWKTLLQFRTVLPYIARILEMSNPAPASTALMGELRQEVRQSVGSLESGQRELRMAVQDQMLQVKRIEEAVTHAQEATERNSAELTDLSEDLRSVHSLVRRVAILLSALLLTLIGLVIYILVRGHWLR